MAARSRISVKILGSGFAPMAPGACTRELEIDGSTSLFDLAAAIIDAFGFQLDHAFGFYDNLEDHYDSQDFHTSFADFLDDDPENGKSVKKTKVSEVFSEGTERLFLFDYGDDWMFHVKCVATGLAGKKGQRAKVVASHGEAPAQYPDEEDFQG